MCAAVEIVVVWRYIADTADGKVLYRFYALYFQVRQSVKSMFSPLELFVQLFWFVDFHFSPLDRWTRCPRPRSLTPPFSFTHSEKDGGERGGDGEHLWINEERRREAEVEKDGVWELKREREGWGGGRGMK